MAKDNNFKKRIQYKTLNKKRFHIKDDFIIDKIGFYFTRYGHKVEVISINDTTKIGYPIKIKDAPLRRQYYKTNGMIGEEKDNFDIVKFISKK